MLKFAASITNKWTILGPSRHTRNVVKALLFRSAEVVDDRLAEVVAIGQGPAGDLGSPRVERLHAEVGILSTAKQVHFRSKFSLQFLKKTGRLTLLGSILRNTIGSFLHLPSAFHAGPWAHVGKSSVDVAHRRHTIQSRINPAV